MKPDRFFNLALSLCFGAALLSIPLNAAKGGKGKPGGGGEDVPLTNPAMVYSADVSGSTRGLVLSNVDGSIKYTLYSGANIGYPQFIPTANKIAFNSYVSGDGSLKILNFSVDETDGVTVGDIIDVGTIQDGFYGGIDASPEGDWLVCKPTGGGGGSNTLWFISVGDPYAAPLDVKIMDTSIHIWNAVWLNSENHIAVSYSVKEFDRDEVAVYHYDPDNSGAPPVLIGAPYILTDDSDPTKDISGVARINNAYGVADEVIVSVTVDTGQKVKNRGRLISVLEVFVFQLKFDHQFPENASFTPLGSDGNRVTGSHGAYSADGQFILTDGTLFGDGGIWRTEVNSGNSISVEDARASFPDWNPDWVSP